LFGCREPHGRDDALVGGRGVAGDRGAPRGVEADHRAVGVERVEQRVEGLEARPDPVDQQQRRAAGITRPDLDTQQLRADPDQPDGSGRVGVHRSRM
jgi:hypothetical protein